MSRKTRRKNRQQNTTLQRREARLEQRKAGQGTLFTDTSIVQQSLHVGPLPAPETFDVYERVLPGSAERIVKMAEEQSAHRRRMESWVVIGGVIQSYIGAAIGGLVALATIWWSVGLIRDGFGLVGLAPTIAALASLVGVFIYARRRQAKELAEKRDE